MARAFNAAVPHVAVGSPVSASNTGAATRSLEARTAYLKDAVDGMPTRTAFIYEQQYVDSAVLDAQAVFWADDTQQFEQGLAVADTDETTGAYAAQTSAECLGIAINKSASTVADIVLFGIITLTPSQVANLIDGEALPGRYFLSGTVPGKLTRQRPGVSVAVGYLLGISNDCETNVQFLVLPQPRNFLEDHVHFQIELEAAPSGTTIPPDEGEEHVVTDEDIEIKGWLPADHASFGGHAPSGAAWGYNLEAHPELKRIWPPLPAEAALLECYHPDDIDSLLPLAGRVMPEFVSFDQYGIWWYSNCYGQVPWPLNLDTTASEDSASEEDSASGAEGCPRQASMRLILSFLKMTFLTARTVVTSLRPVSGQPLAFVNRAGDEATTGDLYAKLTLEDLTSPDEAYGGQVLKAVSDETLEFERGWAVEGVIAESDRVVLTSSHQRYLTPGDADTDVVHQGVVRLDVDIEPGAKELFPQLIKLGSALEREYKAVVYVSFVAGRDSNIRVPFFVPAAGLPSSPTLTVRASLFSRSAGPWCEMTLTYTKLAKPVDGTPTPVTETEVALDFDVVTPTDELAADRMIIVESDAFAVVAGDTVTVTLSRASDAAPSFSGEIGLVRLVAILAGS